MPDRRKITMDMLQTRPHPGEMGRVHALEMPRMFGVIPWGRLLEEGPYQEMLKQLIEEERKKQNKPPNWDPRDVNLPNKDTNLPFPDPKVKK